MSKTILGIVGGKQYIDAYKIFRALIPVMLFSFPGMLLGWPTLGAIGKQKQVTITTVITAVVQVLGLVILILINKFNLIFIALLRGFTELIMFLLRLFYCIKFKEEYSKEKI